MVIIYTKAAANGEFDGVGMDSQRISREYKTTRGFLQHGLPNNFRGTTVRLEVYYGENIYRAPDKVTYIVT